MRYLIIDTESGHVKSVDTITVLLMQKSWDGEIVIFHPANYLVLWGDNWITYAEYNEYVDAGEAVKLIAN